MAGPEPEKKVEVLSQLDVGEEDKKKRKGGDSRVNLQVRASSSSPVAGKQAAKVEGEVKSPLKKKSRILSRKNRKDQEVVDVDKELVEVDDQVMEASPVIKEVIVGVNQAGASQAEGASPWDPLFDPEVFLSKMVDMAGNFARFNTTGSDELARMALGYELKGLLLNYALASRQKAELFIAKDKEALVEKNLANLEKDMKAAKEKCEGDLKTLRDKNAEEVANLTKK
ncbi:hypothetical protein P8452_32298 [Trifolium repens]|nr:hypothetical protein P8452_32298 [Trifolium repens]